MQIMNFNFPLQIPSPKIWSGRAWRHRENGEVLPSSVVHWQNIKLWSGHGRTMYKRLGHSEKLLNGVILWPAFHWDLFWADAHADGWNGTDSYGSKRHSSWPVTLWALAHTRAGGMESFPLWRHTNVAAFSVVLINEPRKPVKKRTFS